MAGSSGAQCPATWRRGVRTIWLRPFVVDLFHVGFQVLKSFCAPLGTTGTTGRCS